MKLGIIGSFILASVIACSIEAEPINYGSDICEYCHMTIVDQQHASEIVTTKGRAYKFDAIECMMNYNKTIDDNTVKLYLINDYNQPGTLLDAKTSTFIITREIPSPMGAFLSSTANKKNAEKIKTKNGGTLYSWEELVDHFKSTDGIIK